MIGQSDSSPLAFLISDASLLVHAVCTWCSFCRETLESWCEWRGLIAGLCMEAIFWTATFTQIIAVFIYIIWEWWLKWKISEYCWLQMGYERQRCNENTNTLPTASPSVFFSPVESHPTHTLIHFSWWLWLEWKWFYKKLKSWQLSGMTCKSRGWWFRHSDSSTSLGAAFTRLSLQHDNTPQYQLTACGSLEESPPSP